MAGTAPRRILVTDATGFVGRHLLPALGAAFPDATIAAHHFDVTDKGAVNDSVRDASPDTCIHLAGITNVAAARNDPDLAWRVNLLGTPNLGRAVLTLAPSCRFVFASSAEVYGDSFRSGYKLDETAPLAPMNGYAATKAAADLALGAMSHEGLRVVRPRLFNHTRPGQSDAFVAPAFARQIARIESGCNRRCCRWAALTSRVTFSTCATSARPTLPAFAGVAMNWLRVRSSIWVRGSPGGSATFSMSC